MKLILLIISFIWGISEETNLNQSDYCNGFQYGWEAGYCYEEEDPCIAPIAPACPVPQVGRDSWQHGYNDGFNQGYNAN